MTVLGTDVDSETEGVRSAVGAVALGVVPARREGSLREMHCFLSWGWQVSAADWSVMWQYQTCSKEDKQYC